MYIKKTFLVDTFCMPDIDCDKLQIDMRWRNKWSQLISKEEASEGTTNLSIIKASKYVYQKYHGIKNYNLKN